MPRSLITGLLLARQATWTGGTLRSSLDLQGAAVSPRLVRYEGTTASTRVRYCGNYRVLLSVCVRNLVRKFSTVKSPA